MKPVDHAVIEAAAKAKHQQQAKAAGQPAPPPPSLINKAVTAGIWVAAAGSLAAVIWAS